MSNYIVRFFVNGEFFKSRISNNYYDWKFLNQTKSELKDFYQKNGYNRSIYSSSSGTEGFEILFDEKKCRSICYNYKLEEETDFLDKNGNTIKVGDLLQYGGFSYHLYRSYDNSYYLRPNKGSDINNITQKIIGLYEIRRGSI